MWKHVRNGVVRVGGIILTLAGILPDNGLPLIAQIINSASKHPIRAILVGLGVALILYSFKDQILDLFGIRTHKRLEGDIRGWLDAFRYSVKREADDQANFKFLATPELGFPVTIINAKEREHYVIIGGRIELGQEDKLFFNRLTPNEQLSLRSNVALILSRSRASFSFVPDNEITIERRVPITADLTEHVFMMAMDDFHHARYGALNALQLIFNEARKGKELTQAAADIAIPAMSQLERSEPERDSG